LLADMHRQFILRMLSATSKSGLLEVVGLIIDPVDEIINGALAQDAGQATVALDGDVVDFDSCSGPETNYGLGSGSACPWAPAHLRVRACACGKAHNRGRECTSLGL
jgi:hypothetical protein